MTAIPNIALKFSTIIIYPSGINKLTYVHFMHHLLYFLMCITDIKASYE